MKTLKKIKLEKFAKCFGIIMFFSASVLINKTCCRASSINNEVVPTNNYSVSIPVCSLDDLNNNDLKNLNNTRNNYIKAMFALKSKFEEKSGNKILNNIGTFDQNQRIFKDCNYTLSNFKDENLYRAEDIFKEAEFNLAEQEKNFNKLKSSYRTSERNFFIDDEAECVDSANSNNKNYEQNLPSLKENKKNYDYAENLYKSAKKNYKRAYENLRNLQIEDFLHSFVSLLGGIYFNFENFQKNQQEINEKQKEAISKLKELNLIQSNLTQNLAESDPYQKEYELKQLNQLNLKQYNIIEELTQINSEDKKLKNNIKFTKVLFDKDLGDLENKLSNILTKI